MDTKPPGQSRVVKTLEYALLAFLLGIIGWFVVAVVIGFDVKKSSSTPHEPTPSLNIAQSQIAANRDRAIKHMTQGGVPIELQAVNILKRNTLCGSPFSKYRAAYLKPYDAFWMECNKSTLGQTVCAKNLVKRCAMDSALFKRDGKKKRSGKKR